MSSIASGFGSVSDEKRLSALSALAVLWRWLRYQRVICVLSTAFVPLKAFSHLRRPRQTSGKDGDVGCFM